MNTIKSADVANDTFQRRSKNSAILWSILIILGICARVGLSAISLGTDDVDIWRHFGKEIATGGLFNLYRTDPNFNQPPLHGYWAMLAYKLTLGEPEHFAFIFRLPGLFADVLSCFLICRIVNRRMVKYSEGPSGAKLAAAFAWSPCAILMSAHHGETDSVYAALCLLAAFCAAELASPLSAGIALGAAINVKLIPVMLIFPFLMLYRSRSDAAKFIGGLAITTIPFIPVLIACGSAFNRNAIEYDSVIDYWGVNQILLDAQRVEKYTGIGVVLLSEYHLLGRYIVFVSILIFALIARRKRLDFYTTGAVAAALFLILTPGFGLQYLILVLPLLFVADPKAGIRYGLFAGAFMFVAYALFWNGKLPVQTLNVAVRAQRGPGEMLATLAWVSLIGFVFRAVTRPAKCIFQPPGRAHNLWHHAAAAQ